MATNNHIENEIIPKRKPVFNATEENLIKQLMEMFGVDEGKAVIEVIKMKRNQANYYKSQGNEELYEQLMYEIGDI